MLVRFAWRSAVSFLCLFGALVLTFGILGILVNGWKETLDQAAGSLVGMVVLASVFWGFGLIGAMIVKFLDAAESRRVGGLKRMSGDQAEPRVRHLDS